MMGPHLRNLGSIRVRPRYCPSPTIATEKARKTSKVNVRPLVRCSDQKGLHNELAISYKPSLVILFQMLRGYLKRFR